MRQNACRDTHFQFLILQIFILLKWEFTWYPFRLILEILVYYAKVLTFKTENCGISITNFNGKQKLKRSFLLHFFQYFFGLKPLQIQMITPLLASNWWSTKSNLLTCPWKKGIFPTCTSKKNNSNYATSYPFPAFLWKMIAMDSSLGGMNITLIGRV